MIAMMLHDRFKKTAFVSKKMDSTSERGAWLQHLGADRPVNRLAFADIGPEQKLSDCSQSEVRERLRNQNLQAPSTGMPA